jgi:dienelactone hydrolase
MPKLFKELSRRKVFRVTIGYVAIAWIIAQVAEFAFETFGAPDWVLKTLVVALLLGLPIAVFLAWAFEITPDGVKRDEDVDRIDIQEDIRPPGSRSGPRPALVMIVVLVLTAGLYFAYDHWQTGGQQQDAMDQLALALDLTSQDRYGEAFVIAQRIEQSVGNHPEVQALLEEITVSINPRVAQADTTVSFRPYNTPNSEWTVVENSSDESTRAPLGGLLLRIEKPGFATREIAVANPGPMLQNFDPALLEYLTHPIPEIRLYESSEVPDDMVRVPDTDIPIYMSGFAQDTFGDKRFVIPSFDIGRYEVSNREFKSFVDDGGYSNPAWWKGIQLVDGTPMGEETVARFVDTTGRSGPSNWELGNYLAGTGDMPVGGISLYEAKAYARYRGMALPTIHHWARAAFAPMEAILQISPAVARASNFDQGGPKSIRTETGIGPWGTVNTAGNAREWVWNTTKEFGLALGGAWTNYDDIYQVAYTIDPLDRAPQNGLRLMHTLGEPIDSTLLEPVELNWAAINVQYEPVSDEVFEAMRFQFTHVQMEPSTVSIEVIDENDSWIAEEVVLGFGGDRMFMLYVVRPANHEQPVQPVIYFPHSGAVQKIPNRELLDQLQFVDYVIQAGRAIIIPVWERMAQRYVEVPDDKAAEDDLLRRVALAWYEDAATTIDYLESREDINADKVGLAGFSYGAYRSALVLATENRFTTAVLISGGAPYWQAPHPMYDPINYFPRVTLPVMMINGRYDHLFLYENSQLRMLELLGTPDEHKKHLVFEEGHFDFPRNTVAREVSDWLDTYLGPVR